MVCKSLCTWPPPSEDEQGDSLLTPPAARAFCSPSSCYPDGETKAQGWRTVQLTLNLGVLASRPLQQANPNVSHAQVTAPPATQGMSPSRGPCADACWGPPSGTPAACLTHTPLLSVYCLHLPPSPSMSKGPKGHHTAGKDTARCQRHWWCRNLEPRAMVRLVLSKARAMAVPKAVGLPPARLLARKDEPTAPCACAARR